MGEKKIYNRVQGVRCSDAVYKQFAAYAKNVSKVGQAGDAAFRLFLTAPNDLLGIALLGSVDDVRQWFDAAAEAMKKRGSAADAAAAKDVAKKALRKARARKRQSPA